MKMKVSRKQKQALDLGVIFSAASLAVCFLITACRKRSIRAAIGAVLTAAGGMGYWAVTDESVKRYKKQPTEETLFTEEECRAAAAHVRRVLGGRHDEQAPPSVLKEIPRDEEATEDDFE